MVRPAHYARHPDTHDVLQPFGVPAVADRIATEGLTPAQFTPLFDHVVEVQARSLVLMMVVLYALLVAALQWRRKQFFGQHLVFSLQFTALWLMAIFVVLYPGVSLLLRFALTRGVHLPSINWDKLIFPAALLLLLTYSFLALRTVYRESFSLSFVKALGSRHLIPLRSGYLPFHPLPDSALFLLSSSAFKYSY